MQYLTKISQGFVKSAVQINIISIDLVKPHTSEVKYGDARFLIFFHPFFYVCVRVQCM